MPVQYWSSIFFFNFVFSIAVRLIKLHPVTAHGEIAILIGKIKNKIQSDHFPIQLKLKETRIVFPSILIQLENGTNEFYFHFYFILRP